ncbi:class II aldolase/adducin family protein [Enterovirga sp. CN4-39]|uniref:class II aldolase/adducin family protein n=1 Tax=Enterovirga sp. CN4-39 TaxID=3400910 RepID=UPI003C02098A
MLVADGASKRTALVDAYRGLAAEGLLLLSAGNLSLREGDRILITPTGADQSIEPEQIVLIDRNGEVGGQGIPSSEWPMHAAIYEARPDVMAIVHTHSDACTALSCLRQPLPAFHYMVAFFGTDAIPCAPYAHFGSPDLARGAAETLGAGNACLLANHGMISVGRSMAEAAKGASLLEMLARQYILALQAGSPVLLSPDDMAEARRRYGYYGRARIPQA